MIGRGWLVPGTPPAGPTSTASFNGQFAKNYCSRTLSYRAVETDLVFLAGGAGAIESREQHRDRRCTPCEAPIFGFHPLFLHPTM
jgi:hypothetical protein